ncbi:uncharacterized protein N7483_012889 [Penicillium malachiteum]|uniref:uncharacterized protein n=1 Tax=Penicillium malachiteum TaxID=1324776 RepID=UPI002547CAC8|nr:uncharacterized protein N7483_012889 [Penicillium malachiteum]KAJ5715708.1 hypothetical protein N7483_012889 [Penicillium malachiteum]
MHVSLLIVRRQNAKDENEALKAQHEAAKAEQQVKARSEKERGEAAATNNESRIKDLEGQMEQKDRERDEWSAKYHSAISSAQETETANNKRIQEFQAEISRRDTDIANSNSELGKLQGEINNLRPKVFDEVGDEDVQILSVTYGTRVFYDSGTRDFNNLLPAFKDAARSGYRFGVNNGLFKDDPNPGHYKSMVIVYRYNRSGSTRRLRTLTGWEDGDKVKFDDWN